MSPIRTYSLAVVLALGGTAALAYAFYSGAKREAERAWSDIASRAQASTAVFDPDLVSGLPEIAQRYFTHAVAPGTPLRTAVQLEMEGTFLLGDKSRYQTYAMEARQILRPPAEFVWIPRLNSGPIVISGSDALVDGTAWTRFWILGLVPVANARTGTDMVRSAEFRAAVEGLWVPASLLPQNGVRWEQIDTDTARLLIERTDPPLLLELTLASDGAVREIVGQCWSNANADQVFRLQPFGGTVQGEATFEGYTIPSVLQVGNHYGTSDYLPFFQTTITSARYLG